MSDPELDMLRLIRESRQAPQGPTRIALLDQAVRVADIANDVNLGIRARKALINEAAFGGAPDKSIVAFAWCLAQCDRDPERLDETDFFWQFKWVCGSLTEFPNISRQKIDAMIADMERRYSRHGYSLRPILELRCDMALDMGELEEARKWHGEAVRTSKDFNNDCAACVAHQEVVLALALDDFEWARRAAWAILKPKGLRCAHKPHVTYCVMALPTHIGGDAALAAQYAKEGYRLTRSNPEFIDAMGDLMAYHAAAASTEDGLRIFERHLNWVTDSGSPLEKLDFYLGARALIASASGKARSTQRKLRLPRWLEIWREDGRYAWTELAQLLDRKLNELAEAFDARNGNEYYRQQAKAARH